MRYYSTIFFLLLAFVAESQRTQKKLETSFDFGVGNHFGLRQIESNFNVNSLTLSNYTLGWNNYFTNYKVGGRLELSYDRMLNSSNSAKFQTDYFRATYFINGSLNNIFGWGRSKKPNIDKKSFLQSFDIDLAAGIGYSGMKSKNYPVSESPFFNGTDDMLNLSFRIAPSLDLGNGIKLFAGYTRISHSAQSNSFDFSSSINNTAFKGAFRTLNFGIRYTPQSERIYSRNFRENQKNLHFITAVEASFGNHFAGSTSVGSSKFTSAGINHLNIGAFHKYPNSKLKGRFDIGYDIFSEQQGELEYTTKYFRTTYQVVADLNLLSPYQGSEKKFDLSFAGGIGFSTMYNSNSRSNFSDEFLNGDDMYTLVFSLIPSYKINDYFSVISNLNLVSNSLQSSSWDLRTAQSNSAFNGRFMNFSLGMRYNLINRKWNDNAELEARMPKNFTLDFAVGNHFSGKAQSVNQSLSPQMGKHFSLALSHPYYNPVYFGRIELAFDRFETGSNYFRSTYYFMTSIKNQLKRNDNFEAKNKRIDLHFGIGFGASVFKKQNASDTFISKGDDMLNMCFRVAPTYQINNRLAAFVAYTFVSNSLQSSYYNDKIEIQKTFFNGRLMNGSIGISLALSKAKPKRSFTEVVPLKTDNSNVSKITPENTDSLLTNESKPDNLTLELIQIPDTNVNNPVISNTANETSPNDSLQVVNNKVEPITESNPTNSVISNQSNEIVSKTSYKPVADYPINSTEISEEQKESLRELAVQLEQNKFLSVVLGGHTDNSGSPEYNLILSRKRAAIVKQYLMSIGVSGDRIKIEYYGMQNPRFSNETTDGRNKNRRVEIDIIKHVE